jgi:hypothetical protein
MVILDPIATNVGKYNAISATPVICFLVKNQTVAENLGGGWSPLWSFR